jgi:histone H3/H4
MAASSSTGGHEDAAATRARDALRYAVAKSFEAAASKEGLTVKADALKAALELVSGMVQVVAEDCAAFSRHARRSTIVPDDVLLLARNHAHARERIEKALASTSTSKKQKPPSSSTPAIAVPPAPPAEESAFEDDDLDESELCALAE